ncbi:hypothetical protein GE09DRAFT_1044624 [Coniochaeta sp. 2T2.1]|nr:hypothetical protein GE09DRAFT_1044624 [Coniochaeta sp. 2T2.1]
MFGTFAHIIPTPVASNKAPKDVPPPTPVNFPRCVTDDEDEATSTPHGHISAVLQGIHRPTEVTLSHLRALGVHVTQDASPADVIGDAAAIPDFDAWDRLEPDEAHVANDSSKRPLNNGNSSPGCIVYLDRKRELCTPNEAAYRAVRRIQPPPGQSQARLGNSYEFYRYLEMFSAFWDDTSKPPPPVPATTVDSPKPSEDDDNSKPESGAASSTASTTSNASSTSSDKSPPNQPPESITHRTGTGCQMPPDCRQNILTSFLKLVAYDFGCNVSAPRTEPRLYVSSPPTPPRHPARNSYFSSGCTFIFRTPTTREAARAGIVEGPLAAVSARHTTSFTPSNPSDKDSMMDLSRELIAALLTAQHRRRGGKTERRIGEGEWWASKPRWGGGPGGPIGREIEMLAAAGSSTDVVMGDKDASPESELPPEDALLAPAAASLSRDGPYPLPAGQGSDSARTRALPSRLAGSIGGSGMETKGAKRLKKSGNGSTLPMYDNYRMVRPPSAAWDRKTRYEAVGRRGGADCDDVFVVSSLFHHVSVVRVRVPDRLMEVLEGADDEGEGKSWGGLEVWRSKWFDFFLAEDRIEAMRLVWGMMAFLMRKEEEEGDDVKMGNS